VTALAIELLRRLLRGIKAAGRLLGGVSILMWLAVAIGGGLVALVWFGRPLDRKAWIPRPKMRA
jgi:hypothetical protein